MNTQRTRGRIAGYVALASFVGALGLSAAPAAAAAKKFDVFANLEEAMKGFKGELAALQKRMDKASPTLLQSPEHKGSRPIPQTEIKYEHKANRPIPQTEIKLRTDDAKMIERHVAKMQTLLRTYPKTPA